MLPYCLSCLPRDIKSRASPVFPVSCALPTYSPSSCQNGVYTMDLWPWHFLCDTHPFGILLNSWSETLCDLTLSCLSNLPSLSHTSEKLFSQSIFHLHGKYHTSHHNSTCNVKSSLTLQVNFFQLWQTHAKMVPNNSCPCLCVIPSSLWVQAEAAADST